MKHKVMDLAKAVEEIPPSNPQVVINFIAKLHPHTMHGEVDSSWVRQVVNDWPSGCPEGRERFLKKVGAKEAPLKALVNVQFKEGKLSESLTSTTCRGLSKWIPGVVDSRRIDGYDIRIDQFSQVELTIGDITEFSRWVGGNLGPFEKIINPGRGCSYLVKGQVRVGL